jgi:hypothetical protein
MTSVSELLSRAKAAIAAGEKSLREATEDIAAAQEQGASQRQIAAEVGKSPAWVNRVLAWRRSGFAGEAFGPAHHRERRIGVHPGKHKPQPSRSGERLTDEVKAETAAQEAINAYWETYRTHQSESERLRAETERIRSQYESLVFGEFKSIDHTTRRILVKSLGMLGSDQAGEVLNAARIIEKQRRKLNAAWDDLLIRATDVEQDMVA